MTHTKLLILWHLQMNAELLHGYPKSFIHSGKDKKNLNNILLTIIQDSE